MSGFWDQFNYKNIHNFDFWPNLAILKPRIYSKSQNTQSLGYEFAKKSRLRRWCKFLSENHKSHGFVTRGWRRLDAAYLNTFVKYAEISLYGSGVNLIRKILHT